jgi:HK97 family phage major capsid protein
VAIETTSSNSTLIASQVQQLLIQPLEQASTFLAAGPTILDSNQPVRIPRIASGTTAGFVSEGSLISDGNVTFDEVTALPSTLKSIKVWLPVSNELIRGSAVGGLDAVLKNRLVTDVSNALDTALFTGTGASDTITGITAQTGVQTGAFDDTDLNSILDGLALAYAENVTPNRIFMNPADWVALRKIQRGTGDKAYVLDPDAHAADQFALFGVPVTVTNRLANGKVVIADMKHAVVVRDQDASVFIADQTLANYDTVAIRVTLRMDLVLSQPKAVVVLTDATP